MQQSYLKGGNPNMMYDAMFNIVQDTAIRYQQSGAYITPDDTACVICAASQQVYTGISRVEVHNGQPINVHAEIVAMQQMKAAGETAAESLLMVNLLTRRPMLPCSGCIQYIISQNPENAKCLVVLPDRNIPLGEIGRPQTNPYANATLAGSMPYNGAVPNGSVYGTPGNMPYNGVVPQGSVYGMPGSMPYGAQPSVYRTGSMPYNSAVPAGSVYTQSSQMSQPYAGAVPPQGRYVGASLPSGNAKVKNSNADYLKNRVGSLMAGTDDDDDDDEQEPKGLFGRLFNK